MPCLALLLASAAWSQDGPQPTARDQALASVQRVAELLREGDVAAALAEARRATELDPKLAAAWRARALCHERRGDDAAQDRESAVECYARSLTLEPYEPALKALANLVRRGSYPSWISEAALGFLPGALERFVVPVRDPRLPADARRDLVAAVTTEHLYAESVPTRHPTYGSRFTFVTYGYLSDPEDPLGRLRLRVRVHYPSDAISLAGRDYATEATRVARLLLHLCAYYSAYVGRSAELRFPRTLPAYLVEGGPTGPESLRRDVAIWNIDAERGPLEWVRAVCRGFGHAALPAVGQFLEPEPWAGGQIGELLFAKWLAVNALDGRPEWGAETVDLAGVLEAEAGRALQAFMAEPPNSERMDDVTERGFMLCAGAALYADSVLTQSELGQALGSADRPRPLEFLWQIAEAVRARKPAAVRLPGGLFISQGSDPAEVFRFAAADVSPCVMLPRRPVRYRVFMAEGSWSLALAAEGPSGSGRETSFAVRLDGGADRPSAAEVLTLRPGRRLATGRLGSLGPGWYIVTLTHDNDDGLVELQSLTFTAL